MFVPLNPSAPEFIPSSLRPRSEFLPASLSPPSDFSPTSILQPPDFSHAFQNPHFLHPHLPSPPPFFNNNFPSYSLSHKPTKMLPLYSPTNKQTKNATKTPSKVFSHGDGFGYRRCIPPRLVKKKEAWLIKSRNLPEKAVPVEDKVVTFLGGKTSLMVKNIPIGFGRRDMLRILDSHCRKENQEAANLGYDQEPNLSSYDFIYLPMDFVRKLNLGYAFVNFTSSVAAVKFCKEFDNFVWADGRSNKTCQIIIAKFQGKEALSLHFKESKFPCHSDEYLPVVLSPPSNGFNRYNLKTLGQRIGGASRRG